jgi:hypothetical protein
MPLVRAPEISAHGHLIGVVVSDGSDDVCWRAEGFAPDRTNLVRGHFSMKPNPKLGFCKGDELFYVE